MPAPAENEASRAARLLVALVTVNEATVSAIFDALRGGFKDDTCKKAFPEGQQWNHLAVKLLLALRPPNETRLGRDDAQVELRQATA
jgi:hypothetical protein